jgi:hypothetical protein
MPEDFVTDLVSIHWNTGAHHFFYFLKKHDKADDGCYAPDNTLRPPYMFEVQPCIDYVSVWVDEKAHKAKTIKVDSVCLKCTFYHYPIAQERMGSAQQSYPGYFPLSKAELGLLVDRLREVFPLKDEQGKFEKISDNAEFLCQYARHEWVKGKEYHLGRDLYGKLNYERLEIVLADPEKLEHPEDYVFVSIPSTFNDVTIPLPAFHRMLDKIEDAFLTD